MAMAPESQSDTLIVYRLLYEIIKKQNKSLTRKVA